MMLLKPVAKVFFLFSCLIVTLYTWQVFVYGIEAILPHMLYQVALSPVLFYLHFVFSPLALAVMPFQFWEGLRRRHLNVHRWTGRVYAISIFFGSIGGLKLATQTDAGTLAAFGFGTLAILWFTTTALAVWHVRAKRIAQHRAWMIRSAALTFGAVMLRIYVPIAQYLAQLGVLDFELAYSLISWVAWVPNLLIVEYWLRRPRTPNRKPQAQT